MVEPIDLQALEHATTITPLGIGGIYLSTWQRVRNYPVLPTDVAMPLYHERARLIGTTFSDQNGTLVFQGSNDGVNAIWQPAAMAYVGLSTVGDFNVVIPTGYVRLVYTNGAVAQAVFALVARIEGVVQ